MGRAVALYVSMKRIKRLGCNFKVMLRANILGALSGNDGRSGGEKLSRIEQSCWLLAADSHVPDCAIWLRLARMRRRILLLCMFASLGRAGRAACLKHSSFGEAT